MPTFWSRQGAAGTHPPGACQRVAPNAAQGHIPREDRHDRSCARCSPAPTAHEADNNIEKPDKLSNDVISLTWTIIFSSLMHSERLGRSGKQASVKACRAVQICIPQCPFRKDLFLRGFERRSGEGIGGDPPFKCPVLHLSPF